MMSDDGSGPDLLNQLAHEFAQRFRHGERPSLTEYTDRYPEFEAQIRDLFPALVMIERFGSIAGTATGPAARTATADGTLPGRLGEYRILRELARGGMGIVYEAVQESLGRHVALKVLPFQHLNDANHLERFRRESQAAARLHHTNIVPVFGVGEHGGIHYFAMQLIQGQPLSSVLRELESRRRSGATGAREPAESPSPLPAEKLRRELTMTLAGGLMADRFPDKEAVAGDSEPGDPAGRVRPVPPSSGGPSSSPPVVPGDHSDLGEPSEANYFRSVARVGVQVAEALAYAHQQGIVHRDIKPSNLMLDTHGTVWVTDFGLAKAEGTGELTGPGDLLGTLRYMAPERFRGQADPRSDIYSLGLTLYEMAALRPAFDAAERAPLIERMLQSEPPRPRQFDGRIPRDLETIILKAIAREPARRYQTAADLTADLQLFLADRPIRARQATLPEQFVRWCRRNPGLAAASIAAAVLTTTLAIGAILAAWTFREQRDQIGRHLERIQEAETRGQERLFESLSAQAGASRQSRRPGQRFGSLEALAQAAAIARELRLPAERLDRLRDEAIACMALPDIRPTGRAIPRPSAAFRFTIDPAMTRYALQFWDGTIQVRRVADDHEIARFVARGTREIHVFTFSPDGRYLASTQQPGYTVTVWDIERREVRLDDPGPVRFRAAGFSPDSRRIALVHDDGELLVYDLETGHRIRRWREAPMADDLAFRPDGSRIAVVHGGNAPSCRIMEADSGRLVRSIPLPSVGENVAWSGDGATLATSCSDRGIHLWEAATGARIRTLTGALSNGLDMDFHPSGGLLCSTGYEGQLRLWDAVLGRPILAVTGSYFGSRFSPDGRVVVGFEDRFTLYHVDPALEYRTFAHASGRAIEYQNASIRRDGRLLAVAASRGVAIWDMAHGTELAFLRIGGVWRVLFEESGDLLTSGAFGVRRWPVRLDPAREEFRIGPPLHLPLPAGGGIAEDSTGRILALPDHDLAFVATPERTIHLGPLDDCRSVSVSPDGEWVATGNFFGSKGAQVWRVRDATRVAELPIDSATGVVFSPDGRWLMTTSTACRLWTVGTWRQVREFRGEGRCFSPDGRLVILEDATRVLHLVEIETGRTVARLESPDLGQVYSACFSPDGARLAVTSNDGPAVHVWDLRAIRRKLAGMGLDWDAPAYSGADPAGPSARPLPPLRVDLGPSPLTPTADPGAYEPVIRDLEAALADRPDQPILRGRLARRCNGFAWSLANAMGSGCKPEHALTLARRSVELAPDNPNYLNTLGVAQYRAGRYAEAIATLDRSLAAGRGRSDGYDLLFQAMAHWRLGRKSQALACYREALEWIERNPRDDEELGRFRDEASALLGQGQNRD